MPFSNRGVCLNTGNVSISRSTSFLRFTCAKFLACPSIPKPVTSVAPCAPCLCMRLAACMFNRIIDSFAASTLALYSAYGTSYSRTFTQNFGLRVHPHMLAATWVPRGFVSINTSPGTMFVVRTICSSRTVAMATPPKMGQGFVTVWPPTMAQPASLHASWKPRIMCSVVTDLAGSGMLSLNARIMSMLWTCTTPAAYTSDSVFAAAILPCEYGSCEIGEKKSVDETE
mmetsp:Transcript_10472/g.23777  ORF Transcript_10472/g.23777 Transcript_10472/m.23777 type:complete len:228 (-) Transcript_10472:295-978(-)